MNAEQRTCVSCGKLTPMGAAYCPDCGASTPTAVTQESVAEHARFSAQANVEEHRERLQQCVGALYEVRERIGQGGFGIVYAAWDVALERDVAIKALRFDLSSTPQLVERFKREARAVAKLRHPNIVPVYTVGEADGLAYFIMPLVKGTSLKALLQREEQLSVDETRRILIDAAGALEAAHQAGIVHRDIKPENILLEGERRRVLLMDFGIAKAATAERTGITATGMIVGTPQYMSPEQATGDRDIDGRSDIYSLGVLGFQLLSGQLPFEAKSIQQLIYQHVTAEPPDVKALRPDVPAELGSAIMRCLAKSPDDRWAGPSQFLEAIERTADAHVIAADERAPQYLARSLHVIRDPRLAIPVFGAFLAVALFVGLMLNRNRNVRWAMQEAIPTIDALIAEEQFPDAFALAQRATRYLGSDSVLSEQLSRVSQYVSISTSPSNADVYFKELTDTAGTWNFLGRSPVESVRLPLGFKRWRVVKAGYVPLESFSRTAPSIDFQLAEEDNAPLDMIRIPSKGLRVTLHGFPSYREQIDAPDYWVGRHEVTNTEFKAFVDGGGYARPEYWKHGFADGTESVSWDQAMARFRDRTRRPGPSTWEGGTYPAGEDGYPVHGISWYEAAAYAEFVGKSLPTIYHWLGATSIGNAAQILPYSNIDNFDVARPAPVGSYPFGRFGLHDMAGNVREWIWNESGDSRYILGGAWNEPMYMFYEADVRSPFDRSPGNGMRLAHYPDGQTELIHHLTDPISHVAVAHIDPVSDELFEAYRSQYLYDPMSLDAITESLDESAAHWRKEKISFAAAYAGERVIAYLFLPTKVAPPYQAVIYWPYSGVLLASSSDNLLYTSVAEFVVMSGRAVIYPVYKGSYERNPGVTTWVPNTTRFYADHVIQAVQDLMRSVDYLETRADIDPQSIGFFGTSWGGLLGAIPLAVEPRIKAAILLAGGIPPMNARPEVTVSNFAPRVTAPVLMINGRYDYLFSLESSQRPLFDLFATLPENKKHSLYETGHGVYSYRTEQIQREVLAWLDRYLGMIN